MLQATGIRRVATAWGVAAALLAAAATLEAGARPIRFYRLAMEEGLSHTTVWAVLQDKQGFMWFGTEDGLNRYDGAGVTLYTRNASDPNSLPYNAVSSLAEDGAGDVWVGTDGGGVARWVRSKDSFVRYSTANGLGSDIVRALHVDKKGTIWIGTRDAGLDELDPRTGTVTHHRHDPADPASLVNDSVYVIHEDRAGALWVGTNAGLSRLAPNGGGFRHYRHQADDPDSLGDDLTVTP